MSKGTLVGDPGIIKLEPSHDLIEGDIVYINGSSESSPEYAGYQVVVDVVDSESFNVELPVQTEKTFTPGTGPVALVLKSVRFKTTTERDAFTPVNGYLVGDTVFVDNNGSNLWSVYTWNGANFDLKRVEEDKVDTNQIFNSIIYNNVKHVADVHFNLIDPFKGFIAPSADRELYYKLAYDPAKYTNGDSDVYQIDADLAWGKDQAGRLWWDLNTVRFLDYEQGELEYRLTNWGILS